MKNDEKEPLLKKPTKVKWVDWKRAGKQAAGAFAMAVIATSVIFTMGLSLGAAMIVGAIGFGGAFAFAAYIINTMINGNKTVTHHTEGKATIAMGTIGWVAAGVLGAGIVLLAGLSSAFILLPVIIAALGAVITGFCTDKHYKAVERGNKDLQEELNATPAADGDGDDEIKDEGTEVGLLAAPEEGASSPTLSGDSRGSGDTDNVSIIKHGAERLVVQNGEVIGQFVPCPSEGQGGGEGADNTSSSSGHSLGPDL